MVQSVFRTFFRRNAAGEFRLIPRQLWWLLVTITLRSRPPPLPHRRRSMSRPRMAHRWVAAAVSREPGPLEAATLVDQIEALLRGLPPFYCQVLDLRLQGCGSVETAERLGVSRQTVYRALQLLQERLELTDREGA